MRSRRLAAAAGLVVLAAGAWTPIDPVAAAPTGGDWHVFVYIVNDSEGQLPYGQDIEEMLVASTSGVEFTVFLDSSELAGPGLTTPHVPNSGEAMVIEIAGGTATVTQNLGEVDSGSPDTLAWFLAQGMLTHPAENNALVVWDHGAGWNGIAFDEDVSATGSRRSSSLDSNDITLAMNNGLAAAGRERLDLLVFDACLMASFDSLGAAAAGNVDYLIASEEVIPGLGLEYEAFNVFAQPGVQPAQYFDTLAVAYEAEAARAGYGNDFTLSMFDTSHATAIGDAISAFATAAAADVTANPTPYLAATTDLHRYGTSGDFWFGFLDIGEYLTALTGVSPEVVAARDQLLASLAAGRVGQRNGSPNFDAATGLTVYFPVEPREFDADFEALATSSRWMPFLNAFYDAQANVVLQTDVGFSAASIGVVTLEPNIYEVTVPVTANFIGSVELRASTVDANGVRTYFESDGGVVENGVASALILPSLTTVSDGLREVVPYTRYVRQPDGTHGYSAFSLQRANGSTAQLNWDRRDDVGPFTVVDSNGVVVAYTPQPGDLAYPISVQQAPGGVLQQVVSPVGLDPNRHWTVTDQLIPAGTEVLLELRLLDANGNVIDVIAGTLIAGQS
ncbi:clostripain-related cysteine peptidase [Desertimonas flava]|uniref:clostripain-related cysteine peptidase n=1 Tax=Desertimonas flava TaxID=2064846 RepID=UPI000E3542A2|nr:clostripain-related cysteine peptidase [Desertimonas flava]